MQYALPVAVDDLRRIRTSTNTDAQVLLLNACDPANPYGPGVEPTVQTMDGSHVRLARLPGNYLVYRRGKAVVFIENSGARVWSLAGCDTDTLRSGLELFVSMLRLPGPLRPFREITVEYCDGGRASESSAEPVLRALGFRRDQNQTMSCDGYM